MKTRVQSGMTLKQFAAWRFMEALDAYRTALESRDSAAIIRASVAVYLARRNNTDSAAINRAFNHCGRPMQLGTVTTTFEVTR